MWNPLGGTVHRDHPGSDRSKTVRVLVFVTYGSYMIEVAASEARDRLAEVIEETRRSGEPISVTQRGQRVAVILAPNVFDRLVHLAEDAIDARELEEARADSDYLPWDEVKAVLGLG